MCSIFLSRSSRSGRGDFMTTRYPEYQALIQQKLSPKRFRHSMNVMERAVFLARIVGADPAKAELAGLLHDVEKNTEPKILLQKLQNSDILFSYADALLPQLWHAPAGMLFVRDKLGIRDPDVLNAIRYHTTGRKDMSPLEKAVYLADLTSADRDFPDAGHVRRLSEEDPDGAMLYSLQFILGDMLRQGKILHPDSLECYNQLAAARTPEPVL